jgi:hypothetical protein
MKKFILLFSLLFLTGCTDYTELENLGITSSLFIKYNGEYEIRAEIYKDDNMDYVTSNGSTISEAIYNFSFNSKNNIYLSHLNAVIIDEDVDIKELIYYFLRNPSCNTNFYLVISNENEIYLNKEDNIGLQIKNICKRLKYYNFFELTKVFLNSNKDIVIPVMDSDNNINTINIYKDNKLVNNLNNKNALIYSILTNKTSNETLKFLIDDKYIILSINQIINKINIDTNIQIMLNIETTILEKDEDIDTSNTSYITDIENKINDYMNNYINDFINELKESESDILGIDMLINNKYKKIDKHFYDYNYDINTKVNINKKGQILK